MIQDQLTKKRASSASPQTTRRWRDALFWLLGTSGGLSYLPVAPGTWGALPGAVLYLVVAYTTSVPTHVWLLPLAFLGACLITLGLSPWAEHYFGEKDPRRFVPDEIAGFLMTVSLFRTPDPLLTVCWAFPMTRILDIVKVPPARQLEALPGGWGILLDDIVASLYAALILNITGAFLPDWFGGRPQIGLMW